MRLNESNYVFLSALFVVKSSRRAVSLRLQHGLGEGTATRVNGMSMTFIDPEIRLDGYIIRILGRTPGQWKTTATTNFSAQVHDRQYLGP